jgi:hypothetical protein
MQRKTAAAVGVGFVAVVGVLALVARSPGKGDRAAAKPIPSASIAPAASTAPSASPLASSQALPEPAEDAGTTFTEGFSTFPDGGKVPELPSSAPKVVKFGVIQFAYAGAQGAPRDARTKDDALKKARDALETAQRDFSEAVRKGDLGSTADAGRMPRGVLEPPIEYWLFSLQKGAIHPEPIDTPRGYWIVRRND